MATRTQSVLGERGRRIRELTSVVQKRFGFSEGSVEVRLLVAVFSNALIAGTNYWLLSLCLYVMLVLLN